MAKPDETADRSPETQPWGTWEELLLACAVNRYGVKCWDSVAVEIKKRSSSAVASYLTPDSCRRKYHDLKRHYTRSSPNEAADETSEIIPWLDELRQLRVAELRREVERYDLSIVSLQRKVKRLTEQIEESENKSPDLEDKIGEPESLSPEDEQQDRDSLSVNRKSEDKNGLGADPVRDDAEPGNLSPESVDVRPVSVEESDRDSLSMNRKCKEEDAVADHPVEDDGEPEMLQREEGKLEPVVGDVKPVREHSCKGSSDSISNEPVPETVKVEQEVGVSDSPELGESVAESKGCGASKESSEDVQSSAGKSRKEGNDSVRCGSSCGDERADQSPAVKGLTVKSRALVDLLEVVRSNKLGSVFERLQSQSLQKASKYQNLIRQHIDLETIETRFEEGWYSDCNHKFYRDLLLLLNNAIVFFSKQSSESVAAFELRGLISRKIAMSNAISDSSAEKPTPQPLVASLPSKPPPEPKEALLLKPKIAGQMVVCRKRSSIAAKASSSGTDRKSEQVEKPVLDLKQPNKSSVILEEHRVTKKRTRDRFPSNSKTSKNNSKDGTNSNSNKEPESVPKQDRGKGESPSHSGHLEPKSEKKKKTPAVVDVKKRGSANFLERMKRTSSSKDGSLLNILDSSVLKVDSDEKGGSEKKRNGNGNGNTKGKDDRLTEQVSKRSSGGRQSKEQGSPAKKNVGRPPKRAAAPSPVATSRKRGREGADTVVVETKPKKKSRK